MRRGRSEGQGQEVAAGMDASNPRKNPPRRLATSGATEPIRAHQYTSPAA